MRGILVFTRVVCGELPLSRIREKYPNRIDKLCQSLTASAHANYTMSKGSKLFTALDRHKGVNHRLEKQKKLQKQAAKRKRLREQQNPPSKNSQVNGIEPLMSGALQPEEDDGSEWESENESDTAAAVVRNSCPIT